MSRPLRPARIPRAKWAPSRRASYPQRPTLRPWRGSLRRETRVQLIIRLQEGKKNTVSSAFSAA